MKMMLDNVGFTVNLQTLWEKYVKMLIEAGRPRSDIIDALKKSLTIGLVNTENLMKMLAEYDPEAVEEMRIRQDQLKKIVDRRSEALKLVDGILSKDSMKGGKDDQYKKFRALLDKELTNDAQYPHELHVESMDYLYRFVLSAFWAMPALWLEYWGYLISNGRVDKANSILELAQTVVGATPVFELKRAELLVRIGRTDDAIEILEKLKEESDPVSTAALTLLFKAVADHISEQEALSVVTENIEICKDQFFVNASRLCKNPEIAWSILEMGMDRFPGSDQLTISAAEFLEQQRDVTNTRSLFQQALKEGGRLRFDIKKKLFQFELDHIAPLDHLNETQKVFKGKSIEKLILDMQRYRFMDLYPLGVDELKILGHLTTTGTFDLTDANHPGNELTMIPPYLSDPEDLKKEDKWIKTVIENTSRATAQENVQTGGKRFPPTIHRLIVQKFKEYHLPFAPPNADETIEAVMQFSLRNQPMYTPH